MRIVGVVFRYKTWELNHDNFFLKKSSMMLKATVDSITLVIVGINWLSKESNEADVIFKINNKAYHAFGCPIYPEEGKKYEVEFDF